MNDIVYAAMRGSELIAICATESYANMRAERYNAQFKRGKRATVIATTLHKGESE